MLLLAIPLLLLVIVPFFITRNKDNRAVNWTVSLIVHSVVAVLVALAAAGMTSTKVMTKTTVYVVADVSHSAERNLDEIDAYIQQIKESLPENSNMGVVCFGKDSVVLTSAGRALKSVSQAKVDDSATDIISALTYTETLFNTDSLKRIVLITDGNDTVSHDAASLSSTVLRLIENGVKVDAIFLDTSLKEGENEVQLLEPEFSESTYVGYPTEAKFLIQSSGNIDVILELYKREIEYDGTPVSDYEKIGQKVVSTDGGYTTVRMSLDSSAEGFYEYRAVLVTDDDISEENNTQSFTQEIVGKTKILLVTGNSADVNLVRVIYGDNAEIDSYVVRSPSASVPFTIEELIVYDEVVIANVDIRNIRNVNAFIDSLDTAVSQYGKSLITLGNLELQTNSEDATFKKFEELLPVKFGDTGNDGRLYTIVLDVSHSMFMASKFTIAKDAAIKLLSILEDDDYVSLVTFSGEIKVQTPRKVRDCKQELTSYISSLGTDHGTDIGLGLEEALKTVLALDLNDNQVMVISDGLSFQSTKDAVDVAEELYGAGATVSAVNTYIYADGNNGASNLRNIVNAGEGGNYYQISTPEQVSSVVFGQMAEDVADVIVRKDSAVNIAKHNDSIVSGITSLPKVSGYILSVAKYDATAPLTITYVKPSGYQETVPLYAYRSHGNGRVASITTSLSDSWTQLWGVEDKSAVITNLFLTNTPKERVDYPFTVTTQRSEYNAYIELVPAILNPQASAKLKITMPSGRTVTRDMSFDSSKYFYNVALDSVGTYRILVTYTYGDTVYTTEESFYIPYSPEYNAFAACDKFTVYEFIRGNGTVTVGEIPSLENDESELTLYKVSYVIPLLIAAVSLFVVDIFIRKLKLSKKTAQPKPKST